MFQSHAPAASGLSIEPITGRVGAMVHGLQLSGELPPADLVAIQDALLRHKVLFFRKQAMDDAAQEAFANLLGTPVAHPTVPVARNTRYTMELNSAEGGRANVWHTDVTFVPAYPSASILRVVALPPFGGDTVWANTEAAYQGLSPELRQLADRLWAVHSNDYDYAQPSASSTAQQRYRDQFVSTHYETEHPVVRVHPISGERSLLLGGFVKKIQGVSREDSALLLQLFHNHITRQENIVRWHWMVGDVAIWDNRATQHYAVNDYVEQRIMHRVTLGGEVPYSTDGRQSRPVGVSAPVLRHEAESVAA